MGYSLHCRIRDGKPVFRMWSSYSDVYITREMTEPQARKYILKQDLQRAREHYDLYIDRYIADAMKSGDAANPGHKQRKLTGAWEETQEEYRERLDKLKAQGIDIDADDFDDRRDCDKAEDEAEDGDDEP